MRFPEKCAEHHKTFECDDKNIWYNTYDITKCCLGLAWLRRHMGNHKALLVIDGIDEQNHLVCPSLVSTSSLGHPFEPIVTVSSWTC